MNQAKKAGRGWDRYVAIGDSSTEGLDDPAGDGTYRGWADRLAYRLAEIQGSLEYANLAIRGKTTHQIRDEQLETAVGLRPDLATVVAGMNDLLRPTFKAPVVVGTIEEMFAALRGAGATVLSFTLPRPGPGMPIAKAIVPRVLRYNRLLREAARRQGVSLVDLEAHPVASDPRLWSDDRLHANSEGHARIAAALCHALGLPGSSTAWSEPLPPLPRRAITRAVLADVVWMRSHLGPWVARHMRGQSSGDGVTAKRPKPTPLVHEITPP